MLFRIIVGFILIVAGFVLAFSIGSGSLAHLGPWVTGAAVIASVGSMVSGLALPIEGYLMRSRAVTYTFPQK